MERRTLHSKVPRLARTIALVLVSLPLACGHVDGAVDASVHDAARTDEASAHDAFTDAPGTEDSPADVRPATDAPTPQDVSHTDVPLADVAPDPCARIAPVASPAANHDTIQHCLDTAHHAMLTAGTFALSAGLTVTGATLGSVGGSTARATVQLTVANGAYTLVNVGAMGHVSDVRVDGNAMLHQGPVTATVAINGDHALVDDVEAFNGRALPTGYHDVGVYFVCEHCTGSTMQNSQVHHHHYGAIFRQTLVETDQDTLTTSDLHDNRCDAITMAGYGRVVRNTIHDNGWDCENGPIPAASIYSLNNDHGAFIDGNTTSNSCGLGFDIDGSSHFTVTNNSVRDPGFQFGGAHTVCNATAAVFLLDVHDFTLTHNTIENSGNAHNRVGVGNDPNRVFSATGAADFSDLPAGGNQAIAFVLGRRFGSRTVYVTGNHFDDNVFRSNCSGACVGLGWFVSRSTGYGPGDAWSAATANYFTSNSPFGSQVGSKRCGGGWYAGNSTCGNGSGAPCNADDYQHNPPGGTMYRDDDCAYFAGQ